MASKSSYQRLQTDEWFDDIGDTGIDSEKLHESRWSRNYRKVHIRKKLRIKIPSLKKLLKRKKDKFVAASWSKFVRRLKEVQSNFGDIFGGNYLFMQVSPPSLKYIDKAHFYLQDHLSSKYCLPRP
ncbi:hypothetical protein DCAR_0415748 [Daucus carota subsp. sativus]|uniref:Uncharacterized protein n=1 Tax=Daucus carota subsp. sativus TaxID=79200 RepID=A0A162A878_DAUCS|nr:hypothetical protein DCAR_0415748 [Daucus carota subsp. sativus]